MASSNLLPPDDTGLLRGLSETGSAGSHATDRRLVRTSYDSSGRLREELAIWERSATADGRPAREGSSAGAGGSLLTWEPVSLHDLLVMALLLALAPWWGWIGWQQAGLWGAAAGAVAALVTCTTVGKDGVSLVQNLRDLSVLWLGLAVIGGGWWLGARHEMALAGFLAGSAIAFWGWILTIDDTRTTPNTGTATVVRRGRP